LEKFRNDYEKAKTDAVNIANKWNVKAEFSNKRRKISKKHFDELVEDFRFKNNEHYFKINVYNNVFDMVCNQLHNRFEGTHEICNLYR